LEPEKSNPFTNPGQIEETMQALEATMPIFQSAQLREGISGVLKTLAETSSSAKAHFESIGNRIDRLSDDVRQYLKIVLPAVALVAALVMGAFYFYLQTMRDWLKSDLNAIAKMNEAKIESLYSRIDQRLAELNAKQDTEISTLKAIAESLKGTPVRPSGPRRADDSPEPAK
jgi:hypothetical protein